MSIHPFEQCIQEVNFIYQFYTFLCRKRTLPFVQFGCYPRGVMGLLPFKRRGRRRRGCHWWGCQGRLPFGHRGLEHCGQGCHDQHHHCIYRTSSTSHQGRTASWVSSLFPWSWFFIFYVILFLLVIISHLDDVLLTNRMDQSTCYLVKVKLLGSPKKARPPSFMEKLLISGKRNQDDRKTWREPYWLSLSGKSRLS